MSRYADVIARAILYEGFILERSRSMPAESGHRGNSGIVYPPGACEGRAVMQTQCLALTTTDRAELDISVRFLHLMACTVREHDPAGSDPAQSGPSEKRIPQSWREGTEEQITLTYGVTDLLASRVQQELVVPGSQITEEFRDDNDRIPKSITREESSLRGLVHLWAEPLAPRLFRITVRVENRGAEPIDPSGGADVLMNSLLATHTILAIRGGEFVSLIDPPQTYEALAEQCENIGTFPVLAGDNGGGDVMLSSSIILYDHPKLAMEGPLEETGSGEDLAASGLKRDKPSGAARTKAEADRGEKKFLFVGPGAGGAKAAAAGPGGQQIKFHVVFRSDGSLSK